MGVKRLVFYTVASMIEMSASVYLLGLTISGNLFGFIGLSTALIGIWMTVQAMREYDRVTGTQS